MDFGIQGDLQINLTQNKRQLYSKIICWNNNNKKAE